MSHSPDNTVAITNYVEANRLAFDDGYEELEEYMDGDGSCLVSLSVAIVVLGIAAIMIGR